MTRSSCQLPVASCQFPVKATDNWKLATGNWQLMYVELHSRSAFSFLEGASTPEELIAVCANLGMPAMALLDRDGVYGSPRFHLAAKKAGIKAHIGAEVTCAAFSPRKRPSCVVAGLRPAWTGPSPVTTPELCFPGGFRLPLLVASRDG